MPRSTSSISSSNSVYSDSISIPRSSRSISLSTPPTSNPSSRGPSPSPSRTSTISRSSREKIAPYPTRRSTLQLTSVDELDDVSDSTSTSYVLTEDSFSTEASRLKQPPASVSAGESKRMLAQLFPLDKAKGVAGKELSHSYNSQKQIIWSNDTVHDYYNISLPPPGLTPTIDKGFLGLSHRSRASFDVAMGANLNSPLGPGRRDYYPAKSQEYVIAQVHSEVFSKPGSVVAIGPKSQDPVFVEIGVRKDPRHLTTPYSTISFGVGGVVGPYISALARGLIIDNHEELVFDVDLTKEREEYPYATLLYDIPLYSKAVQKNISMVDPTTRRSINRQTLAMKVAERLVQLYEAVKNDATSIDAVAKNPRSRIFGTIWTLTNFKLESIRLLGIQNFGVCWVPVIAHDIDLAN